MKPNPQTSIFLRAFWIFTLFVIIAGLPAIAFGQTTPLEKRTLYVIGTHNGIISFPLQAYIIVQDDIYHADTWYARSHDVGPVGLAVDENNENLFVSYEGWNGIEVFDAKDATPLGQIILVGTNNLAGMVVHQDRGHLYVVDRGQMSVYVYDTTTFNQEDWWFLPTGTGAWGIDLLDNWLFVADGTNVVRYYDIDTHTEVGNYTQNYPAVAIAVTDYPELTSYTAAYIGASSSYLTQYFINTGVQNHLPTGNDTKGVTLNPALELAYITQGNKVHVVDTSTFGIHKTKQLNWIWSPADCLASFIPFGGTVKKTCTSHPNGKIYKGDTVVFNIALQNRHIRPIHVLPVMDTYDTTQLSFVSATPAPNDMNDDGQLDWSDLIAQIGADLPTGEWAEIEVTFDAIEECEGELAGVNTAQMYDVEDDEGTSLPDASGQFDYTINCKCRTNADCDDTVFCNGAEICDPDGSCTSPGNPCPLDDNLFCNGTETDNCNEDTQECEHINPPCDNDDVWCNGEEVCNENTDTCNNSGSPCSDDGQFCNGEEACDEEADECASSGDPCDPDEQCNESTDSCDAVESSDDDSPEPEGDDDELWPEGKVTGGCCGCE